jgi:hypothetical protein
MRTTSATVTFPPVIQSVTGVVSRKRRPRTSNVGRVGGSCARTSRYAQDASDGGRVRRETNRGVAMVGLCATIGGRSRETNIEGDVNWGIIGLRSYANDSAQVRWEREWAYTLLRKCEHPLTSRQEEGQPL